MSARIGRLTAALALAAVTAAACHPAAGSPNCPPGQWYVDKPGAGWICASGPAFVFTPGYTFAPSSPPRSAA